MAAASQPFLTDDNATVQQSSLREQLATIVAGLTASTAFRTIAWVSAAIVAVIVATAFGQILLNRWNQPFYDALQRRDLDGFLHQLLVFAAIAIVLLVLNVGQQWLNQRFRLKLREALTLDLISNWMRPGRAFRLAHAGAIGVNPDQRMQQDAGRLADVSTDLGIGFIQSLVLLVSFVGVLWELSAGFSFTYDGRTIAIPGYMVWAAIIYTGTASWLSWMVGRPLIRLNGERYAREADLRYSMVRINENIDAIALARGEAGEETRLRADLDTLLAAIRRIFAVQINVGWVTDTYGWITVVAPILVAAPVYFSGNLSFGGLMMAVGAFNQVHASLRWFINNIGAIADWRATLMRVADFRLALQETEALHDEADRIEFAVNADDRLTFDGVEIMSGSGCTRLVERKVRIAAGERVQVTGEPSAGKTLFFRAVAGLWPWGRGRIGMPAGDQPVFVPRTPYAAPSTLRDALGAPQASDERVRQVLAEIGLERLWEARDQVTRWEHALNDDERRLLALARAALQGPRWLVIDEALDTFDSKTLKRVLAMLRKRLPKTGVVSIGRTIRSEAFFTRRLTIAKAPSRAGLHPPKVRRGAIEPPPARRRTENSGT